MKPIDSNSATARRRKVAATLLSSALVGTMLSSFAAQSAAAAIPAEVRPQPSPSVPVPAATLTAVHVPGTTAMSAAAVDLGENGYTEREFYANGKANRYRNAVATSLQNATVIDGNWPYRTRVLVRSPQPSHFNGTLIVEWTNVTIGVDADFVFAEAHQDLLRQGYAYAVVSAQKVGVDRLRTWSPQRYGTLSVNASNVDPQGGGSVDSTQDPLSWDIFTQVSAALKANLGKDPALPGLKVRDVIAAGQSQSAGRLNAYYNTIQPLSNFFNGFLLWDRAFGPLRSDLTVPAISVDSEAFSTVQPAPIVPTSEYTRHWEVAGSTHGSIYAEHYVDAMFNRDKGLIGPNGQPESFTQWVEPSCTVLPAFSTIPNGLVISAAMDSVKKWIETARPGPASIYFQRDAAGHPLRDAQGKVKGGVRLPEFVAPTADVSAVNGTQFPCSVSGSHRYYTSSELEQRYGSTRNYVLQVAVAAAQAAKGGYLLPFDAVAEVADASRVHIR